MSLFRLLVALLIILVVVAVTMTIAEHERQKAQQEKEKLLRRKRKLVTILAKKRHFKQWRDWIFIRLLYPGYIILLSGFGIITYCVADLLGLSMDLGELLNCMAVTEGVILVVSLFAIQQPKEFLQVVRGFGPQLKRWVYGKRVDIDIQIQGHANEIGRIDWRIRDLDKIINV